MLDSVALVKYENNIEKALDKGIGLINGFNSLKSPVIIKPNICTQVDKTGLSVNDVQIVEILVRLILKEDQNLSIKIVESDSMSKFADEAFDKFGYKDLEERMQESGFDVSLINLSYSTTVETDFEGSYFKKPKLPKILIGSKFFISLAVAKTHYLTFITGTLKNLFGLLPRKDQSFYHSDINDVIVDLNRFIRPNLCIVDARVGLEGWEGPKSRSLNRFIIGTKPVSTDATMARIMGFEPERANHLVEAANYDLGSLTPKVVGEKIETSKIQFNPP
ncbi:MAG: DUF362 domain-containing protein [Candidatus Heimdallarchaeota archaeon]|nr:DUF362 domain-containing protein [Candidatus Heimdallarchaeota archaeon]MCK4877664.1 DUF362 domain-containing protein [Candidatus Heimdallarchaeota archaeon]